MTLVAGGLLLGMLGLFWAMLIELRMGERQATRLNPSVRDEPDDGSSHRQPKAA